MSAAGSKRQRARPGSQRSRPAHKLARVEGTDVKAGSLVSATDASLAAATSAASASSSSSQSASASASTFQSGAASSPSGGVSPSEERRLVEVRLKEVDGLIEACPRVSLPADYLKNGTLNLQDYGSADWPSTEPLPLAKRKGQRIELIRRWLDPKAISIHAAPG